MASPSTVITLGYGSFGGVNLLPTLGYGSGAVSVGGFVRATTGLPARVKATAGLVPRVDATASAPARVKAHAQIGEGDGD